MVLLFRSIASIFVVLSLACAEDYAEFGNDYAQDGIYYDYANRQVEKQAGKGGALVKLFSIFGAGYFACSKFGCESKIKKLKRKQTQEQKALYSQYYNDVYKLQEFHTELYGHISKLETALKESEMERELDALQRDMDEFKQPDVDGDGYISRAEFNHYVKTYLSNYPGLAEKDYPRFEDFDHNRDGLVSFEEYAQQMAMQVQQAELDSYYKQQAGQKVKKKAEKGIQGLHKETTKAGSFDDLYAQLRKT